MAVPYIFSVADLVLFPVLSSACAPLPCCCCCCCVSRVQPVFFILHTAFFGLHYLFASQTAHIGALYAAFLAMMLAAGGWGLLVEPPSKRSPIGAVFHLQ